MRTDKRFYVAFRPDQPLVDGEEYKVELFGLPSFPKWDAVVRVKAGTVQVLEAESRLG